MYRQAAATQPLTYAKNCFQQRTPLSLVPRVVYRGTPASMAADGTLIGTQFACCGFLQKRLLGGEARPLTAAEEKELAEFGEIALAQGLDPGQGEFVDLREDAFVALRVVLPGRAHVAHRDPSTAAVVAA